MSCDEVQRRRGRHKARSSRSFERTQKQALMQQKQIVFELETFEGKCVRQKLGLGGFLHVRILGKDA